MKPTAEQLIRLIRHWHSPPPPYKACGCGRQFTRAQWERLPDRGHVLTEDETGRFDLELRDCPCGSTIGIEVRVG